jgi:hypothetical protein
MKIKTNLRAGNGQPVMDLLQTYGGQIDLAQLQQLAQTYGIDTQALMGLLQTYGGQVDLNQLMQLAQTYGGQLGGFALPQ